MYLFSKDTLNELNVTVKTFIMLHQIYIPNNCRSFKHPKKKVSWFAKIY